MGQMKRAIIEFEENNSERLFDDFVDMHKEEYDRWVSDKLNLHYDEIAEVFTIHMADEWHDFVVQEFHDAMADAAEYLEYLYGKESEM